MPDPPKLVASTTCSLSICWDEPADNGAPITDYQLECADGGTSVGAFQRVFTGLALDHTLPGLKVAAAYLALCGAEDRGWYVEQQLQSV